MTDLSNNNCIITESMNKYKFDYIQTIFNSQNYLLNFSQILLFLFGYY